MAKTTHPAKKTSAAVPKPAAAPAAMSATPAQSNALGLPQWAFSFRIQALAIVLAAIIAYFNTSSGEYALDDLIVIVKNEYVYEGFNGLHNIFTKDAMDSYVRQTNSTNSLEGGRYRPLSIATFAIEQQFLGPVPLSQIDSVIQHARDPGPQQQDLIHAMHVRHVFNIIWYALAMVALLYFLRYIVLKDNYIIAFIATLLFTVHPIHTEVVANVKSRDEIMSLLFICLTFIFAFRYKEQNKIWQLAAALACYFLAFLSKEYAIALIGLLPLSFWLFNKESIGKSAVSTLPYLAVAIIYIAIRFQFVGAISADTNNTDIWNNPYARATPEQLKPTQIATMLNYIKLLLFPYSLSSDYSYDTIPYKTIGHPLVWLSLVVHLSLLAAFVYMLKKRHVLSFAIAFYFAFLLLVCNLIYNLGGTMGERLIFHSSVGYCIAVAWLLYKGAEKLKSPSSARLALTGAVSVIVLLFSIKTIARNEDWKTDFTLFSHDVKVVPNSMLVNADMGVAMLDKANLEKDPVKNKELIQEGIKYLDKALSLDSTCLPALLNRGLAYFKLKDADRSRRDYEQVVKLLPTYGPLPELYYNVGVLFYFEKRYTDAIQIWQNVLKLKPSYTDAQKNIYIAQHDMAVSEQVPPPPQSK